MSDRGPNFQFVDGSVDAVVPASNLGVPGYGSFVGGGDWTGVAASEWYAVDGPFKIWVSGYPASDGNELKLEYRDKYGLSSIETVVVEPGRKWVGVDVEPPRGREVQVRLLARDGARGAQGWFGFSPPFVRDVGALTEMVEQASRSLLRTPGVYRGLCYGVLAVFALWLVIQGQFSGQSQLLRLFESWPVHLLLIAATFVAIRWPYSIETEVNADESVEIAEAIKLFVDPRFWVSVDGYTHGPVVSGAVMLPGVLGLTIGFGSIRWLSIALWAGTCFLVSESLSDGFGRRAARLGTLPLVVGLATATQFDFVTFNCEPVVLFMLAAGTYLGVRARRPDAGWLPACGAGVMLGLVPYAKLQGVPMAAVIALAIAAAMVMRRRPTACHGNGLRGLLGLVLGGLAPTFVVVTYLASVGAVNHFIYSYVVWNFAYAARGSMDLGEASAWVLRGVWAVPHTLPLLAAAASATVVVLWPSRNRQMLRPMILGGTYAICVFLAGVFVAAKPGNQFHHYVLFALVPGLVALAIPLTAVTAKSGRWFPGCAILIVAVCLPSAHDVLSRMPWIVSNRERAVARAEARRDLRIAEVILQYGCHPQTLVVWGWMSRYHVLTGLPPATQHNFFDREMQGMVADDDRYFYSRFIRDFERSPPRVFVDAVAPGAFAFSDRSRFGHEAFPELAGLIASRFTLVDEVEGIRIYVRPE